MCDQILEIYHLHTSEIPTLLPYKTNAQANKKYTIFMIILTDTYQPSYNYYVVEAG